MKLSFIRSTVRRLCSFTVLFLIPFISKAGPDHLTSVQEIRITLRSVDQPVSAVFEKLSDQSGLSFFYHEEILAGVNRVTINAREESLDKVLHEITRQTKLTFKRIDNTIAVSRIAEAQPEPPAQGITVSGTVTDAVTKEPLVGATVWIKETTVGSTADIDGKYSIKVTGENAVLAVSFVGYTTREVLVSGRSVINFELQPSASAIEEVVVVGYGTQKKESVVGAITSVKPGQLKLPAGNISSVLAGQLGGVISIQRTGEPGSGAQFWIRGISTTNSFSNKPLVLVDGIEREIDLVDVEDIETFSVLKDATATAIYGVRGANGVLLITTRSGDQGPAKVTVRAETGVVSPTRLPKMADAVQYTDLYNEAYSYTSDGGKPLFSQEVIDRIRSGADPDLYPNVDWPGKMFKPYTFNQRVNTNISGGGTIARYFVSGTYYHEGSIYREDETKHYNTAISYNKFNFRSNVDVNLTPSTIVQVNLSNIYETRISPNADKNTIWNRSLIYAPGLIPAVYSDGSPAAYPGGGNNPYNLLTQSGFKNEYWNNAQALLGLNQDFGWIVKGLTANVKFSWDAVTNQTVHYSRTPNTFYATGRDADGNLIFRTVEAEGSDVLGFSKGSTGRKTVYLESSLTYSRVFGVHRVSGLFLYNQKSLRDIQPEDIEKSVPYRHQGIAGRVTYGYHDRYFLESNFGYNGSENFSPGKRFGFFPSIALGWLVSSENFFAPVADVVSKLKLRGSYGLVGNDQIGRDTRFIYQDDYSLNINNAYSFGRESAAYSGAKISRYASQSVAWEKSQKLDLGLELSLWDRVNLQADYFRDYRTGIFLRRDDMTDVAGVSDLPYANIGEVLNRGVDFQLESFHTVGELQISVRGNFVYNRNKVLKNAQPMPEFPYMTQVGLPVNQQTGYVAMGLFSSQEEIDQSPSQFGTLRAGDVKYKDVNGDGTINSYDQIPIGRTWLPEITYGFGASLQWKGFDLSFLFSGSANFTMILDGNAFKIFSGAGEATSGFYEDVYLNSWRLDNPDPNAKYPRATVGANTNNNPNSTVWQRDMSFLRLKNATVGYTVPQHLSQKLRIKTLHFYCSGVNLLTFSKFKLFDPEIYNPDVSESRQGAVYPSNRIISIGMNLNF
ncbi:MAG: TonB-dependent receptor [Bacteroidales bacterium]|jgi:TonB-linked SusC/RagA family outer membrane protein|nr:TonB-dependent receptor [Bacteroidales bacterium]